MECLSIVNSRVRKRALSRPWGMYELYGLHLCPFVHSSTGTFVKSATKSAGPMNWTLKLEHLVVWRAGTSLGVEVVS